MGSCGKIGGMVAGGLIAAIIIVIISVLAKSFQKLETSEVAITYNTFTKVMNDDVRYEGLHIGSPTLTYIKFSSVFKTLSYAGLSCLNVDGVTITLSISMQYKIRPSYIRDIIVQFKDMHGYEMMLNKIGSTAIHDVCCMFNTTQFQSERGRFQEELSKFLVDKFNTIHTDVTDIQVNNINRPWKYENAIKSKESAREDIQVARNEKPRMITEAKTKKREALSEAEIILNAANSESKIIMNKAQSEGEAILNDYTKEAASYRRLKEDNGLDNEGFLSYMGVRVIASAKNPVNVGMKGPAQTSFVNN